MNGRPAGKPRSLPVPCSRKRSPVRMRSTESISGARNIEPTIGSAGRETTSLISFTFQPENALTPSTGKLGGGLGDEFALMPGAVEFNLRRLALTLPAGDRSSAVGRAAHDLVKSALPRMAVGQADDDQAEVHQVGDNREKSRLVAAVLGRARGKGAAHLSYQGAGHPQLLRLLPEAPHGRGHAAEPSRRADDDRVIR